MSSRLDLVTILVNDMPATTSFYTELLGFEIVEPFTSPNGDFVWLRSKERGCNIALQDAATRASKPTQADIPEESGGVMLGFLVENAEVVYHDWEARGIELRTTVVDMGKGRTFGAKDPSGNYVQIFDVYPKFREIQRQLGLD